MGPRDPSLMSPAYARVSSVSPKRGHWRGPYTGPQYSGVVRTAAQAVGLPFQADVRPSFFVIVRPSVVVVPNPVLRCRVDGYPKRYIVFDPFYSIRSKRFNLNPTSLRSGIERGP